MKTTTGKAGGCHLPPPGLDRYLIETTSTCPYGLPGPAIYRQARLSGSAGHLLGRLLAAGFRRHGNLVYTMKCPGCRACIPIRLRPAEFTPTRSQKRVHRRNRNLRVEIAPPEMSSTNLILLQKFLDSRYPDSIGRAEDYYAHFFVNSITETVEVRYLQDGRLLGCSIVDVHTDWLNVVYFYFDPDRGRTSPGTNNILQLIEFCRRHGVEHLYLGYWLAETASMRYKSRFTPHYLLREKGWTRVTRDEAAP